MPKQSSWKDIFSDRDAYGDDMVVALKDKNGNDISYTMGDLRTYNEEHDGELLRTLEPEVEKLKRDRQEVEADRQEVLRMYQQTGHPQPQPDERATKTSVAAQFQLDENDPLVGQLVKELNKTKGDMDTKLNALNQSLAQQNNILATVLRTYINRSTQEQYRGMQPDINALPEKSRTKYTYDILKKHAETNRMNDPDGLPDLARALKDLAGEEIYAARLAKDKAEWEKDYEQKRRMTSAREIQGARLAGDRIPKPKIDVMHSKDPIGEALTQASQDDELWNSILNSNTPGTT